MATSTPTPRSTCCKTYCMRLEKRLVINSFTSPPATIPRHDHHHHPESRSSLRSAKGEALAKHRLYPRRPSFPCARTSEAVAKANSDEWVYEANLQHDECVGNCGVALEIVDVKTSISTGGPNTATRSSCRRGRHDHRFAHPRRRVSRFPLAPGRRCAGLVTTQRE